MCLGVITQWPGQPWVEPTSTWRRGVVNMSCQWILKIASWQHLYNQECYHEYPFSIHWNMRIISQRLYDTQDMLHSTRNTFPVQKYELILWDVTLRRVIVYWTGDDVLSMNINKLKWNINQIGKCCFQENAFQNAASNMPFNVLNLWTRLIYHRRMIVPLGFLLVTQ